MRPATSKKFGWVIRVMAYILTAILLLRSRIFLQITDAISENVNNFWLSNGQEVRDQNFVIVAIALNAIAAVLLVTLIERLYALTKQRSKAGR